MRVDLWDAEDETRYATFQHFTIASESNGYRLNLDGYAGDAGDAMAYHNGKRFSTYDHDNDSSPFNCAQDKVGGWWYNNCYQSNLNGEYLPGGKKDSAMNWYQWKEYYGLKATTMKIRPTKKL